ncbi:unnamed protein product [Penicillium roqueforti FM164]|uniref:Genomic scaffold, ProqFM164S01 n=1 Tax=Penicillium roqueforti (strain FM164) TaxID=1365484 RepID=W6PUU5_PENRF|nr:unnamed protein product [Penicillium roqueforti FM164]
MCDFELRYLQRAFNSCSVDEPGHGGVHVRPIVTETGAYDDDVTRYWKLLCGPMVVQFVNVSVPKWHSCIFDGLPGCIR